MARQRFFMRRAGVVNQPFDTDLGASSSRTVTPVSENVECHQGGYADYQVSLTAARGLW